MSMSIYMQRQEQVTWKGKYQIPSMERQVSHMHNLVHVNPEVKPFSIIVLKKNACGHSRPQYFKCPGYDLPGACNEYEWPVLPAECHQSSNTYQRLSQVQFKCSALW